MKSPSFEFIPIPAGAIAITQVNLIPNSTYVRYALIIPTKAYASKPEILRSNISDKDCVYIMFMTLFIQSGILDT